MRESGIKNRVRLFLQNTGADINILAGDDSPDLDKAAYLSCAPINLSRSALQRPELNRAQLAAMLRKALKKQQSRKYRSTYWAAFLTSYIHKNANSNDS